MNKSPAGSRVWVKICGLTRAVDVANAVDRGADAVGFILVARSPRRLTVAQAADLAAGAGSATVVALVEGAVEPALECARRVGASMIQPYGPHATAIAGAASAAGLEVLLPVAVAGNVSIDLSDVPGGVVPLLDTAVARQSGGTGVAFEWARAASLGRNVVVAGGLNPENVAEAILAAHPWGVDASSGLEAAIGVKDAGKVAAFITAATSG